MSKFADMETFEHVVQAPYGALYADSHPLKGKWRSDFFKNDRPIVLELGCGKGEYTVGLARKCPEKNFIGIDIKGARMWQGAKDSLELGLKNVGFLRTNIELIDRFFEAGEVDEIWLTFPDPQMKKVRKRLTSTRFIDSYREFLREDGIIHLKTDSAFLFTYTCELINTNHLEVIAMIDDIDEPGRMDDLLAIQTYYEQQWRSRGITIKYVAFRPHRNELVEPEVEIEYDAYRSFGRNKRTELDQGK